MRHEGPGSGAVIPHVLFRRDAKDRFRILSGQRQQGALIFGIERCPIQQLQARVIFIAPIYLLGEAFRLKDQPRHTIDDGNEVDPYIMSHHAFELSKPAFSQAEEGVDFPVIKILARIGLAAARRDELN